jgi:hypothetical protein
LGRSCIALIPWPDLSKDNGCASETAFQASVKSAPAEPSVQEPGIKGVAASFTSFGSLAMLTVMRPAQCMLATPQSDSKRASAGF